MQVIPSKMILAMTTKLSKPRKTYNSFEEGRRREVQENKKKRFENNHSTSLPLLDVLKYNKPIFPKQPRENTRTGKTSVNDDINYSIFDNKLHYSKRDNTTLTKNIRFCRMWFQCLKLCLEAEENGQPIRNGDESLKVDRKFYKNWHLNDIKLQTFDYWFKSHKHLFTLKPVQVITRISKLPNDSIFISIPKSSSIVSVKKEIGRLLKDKLSNKEETEVNFSKSKTPYISLHIEYNLLVLAYNNVPRDKILTLINDRYNHLIEAKTKKPKSSVTPDDVISHSQSVTRKLNDGKKRMKRVCAGVFP